MELTSQDSLTLDIVESGCVTWDDLVRSVRNFKYGRGAQRGDFESVWYHRLGTCSTKHGFLYTIAERNQLPGVQLIVGIYLMNGRNTPKIAHVLEKYGLDALPEAHTYLKTTEGYVDATTNASNYQNFSGDVLEERIVNPAFLVNDKINYHKEFLLRWINNTPNFRYDLEETWAIREACIAALS